jgi:predicted HicB family RNase H-like nuclease
MDLTPYLETLRRDLAATAAPGGTDLVKAADLLAGSLESSARLCLLEALSDAAAEITARLDGVAAVEVRLHGREADMVVSDLSAEPEPSAPPPIMDSGDVARITLRLPEPLKEVVEHAATAEGISVNAWLVRAISAAVHSDPRPPRATARTFGRRVTGYAQA